MEVDQNANLPEELLPQVYDELRRMAANKMLNERSDHTLSPTALVHEVFVRFQNNRKVATDKAVFFKTAAEAMRRILIDHARQKKAIKRGGDKGKVQYSDSLYLSDPIRSGKLIELDDALQKLESVDPLAAEVVKLRYFAGLTIPQTAEQLRLSPRKVDMVWAFAKTWLRKEMEESS